MVSYSKGSIPHQREGNVSCSSPNKRYVFSWKSLCTLKANLSYFSTLLSNYICPFCNLAFTFVLVLRKQLRETEESNSFTNQLLVLPFIFFLLMTENLPVIIFEYSSLLECIKSVLRSNQIGCQVNHSNYISCGRGMFLGYSLTIMTFFKTRKCSPSMEYRKLPELLSKS